MIVSTQSIIVPLLFFLIVFFLCMFLVRFFNQRNKNKDIVKKIQQDAGFNAMAAVDDEKVESDKASRVHKNFFISFFSFFGKNLTKKDAADSKPLKMKFLQAGLSWENTLAAFWGAKLFLPFVSVALSIAVKVFVFKTMTYPQTIVAVTISALLGYYLPDIWLKNKADKRKERLLKGLPDTLDMLVVCVEAGMGLDSALDRVGREMDLIYPELSHEFSILNHEIRVGKDRNDALRSLAERSNLQEMNSLVSLLIQTNKFGTSVSTALKVFAESFRTKRFQLAEEIAAKLPVTILIPLLIFIFPAMFVIILGPAAISIYKNIILK